TSPNLLLNELHKGVRYALKQHETDNRDGMDLALITIDKQARTVEYAGAKNPLIYIQGGELKLVKADKMPIGGEQKEQERIFAKTTIDISEPTMFYLFSDGYQDQFGGKDNKKFSIARMKELFLSIHTQDMTTQQTTLQNTLHQWRTEAGEHQIDDILVVGVRV
ncbi:MAG: histidine kinase, partial [Bacteroidetes bacterium]